MVNQRLRRNAQRIGGGEQIGLVRGEKVEHGLMRGAVGNRAAQAVGREPGERKEAFGALAIAQNPAERRQCERVPIGRRY